MRRLNFWHTLAVVLLAIYFASIFFFALRPLLGWRIPVFLGPVSTLFVWAFAILHAWRALGWRRALTFFVIAFVVGLALEAIGVATGWVYGGYHYSERLGFMLFGVPVLVPLAWFMVIYLADCLRQKLIGDRSLLWNSVIGAVAATAWDVVADPQMARTGLWIWDRGGDFFGVPIQNFVGWWITSFIVLILYHTVARTLPPQPISDHSPSFAMLPIIAYSGLSLSFIIGYAGQGEGAMAVITFFSMGAISLIALAKPKGF